MNSMSLISAPARNAMATPSPVATAGICGVAVELAHAAGGEQNGGGQHLLCFTPLVDEMDAADAAVFHDQVGGEFKLEDGNIFQSLGFGVEGAQNLASGGVAVGVQDAVAAVRALPAEGELGALPIEFRAPLNQFLDALGSVFDQHLGGFGIAETIARLQGVLQVEADFVFIAECGRDAALSPLRVGFGDLALGQNEDSCPRRPVRWRRAVRQLRRQSPGNQFGTAQTPSHKNVITRHWRMRCDYAMMRFHDPSDNHNTAHAPMTP